MGQEILINASPNGPQFSFDKMSYKILLLVLVLEFALASKYYLVDTEDNAAAEEDVEEIEHMLESDEEEGSGLGRIMKSLWRKKNGLERRRRRKSGAMSPGDYQYGTYYDWGV